MFNYNFHLLRLVFKIGNWRFELIMHFCCFIFDAFKLKVQILLG